ncbi:MAG: TonB family protein [Firmicutes bacterium]|nr:TonB family protein [Bacillota bacterium]
MTLISWLTQATGLFSITAALLLLGQRFILPRAGARATYTLWFFPAVSLLAPIGFGLISHWSHPIPALSLHHYSTTQFQTLAVTASPSLVNVTSIIIGLWAIGAALLIGLIGIMLLQQQQQHRQHFRGIRVCYRSAGSSPGVFGLLRPTLCLPRDFNSRFTKHQQRLIVAHEFSHWRHGDLHHNIIAWVVVSLQWFNPLAWLAYRHFRHHQELACDARVLATLAHQRNHSHVCYANALLAAMSSAPNPKRSTTMADYLCSTQYGRPKGDIKMIKQRFTLLNQGRANSKKPFFIGLVSMLSLSSLWLLPASADSQNAEARNIDTATPIVRIEPRYPQAAARDGVEGYVDFAFEINRNGEVANLEVISAQPEGVFEEAASQALQRWRFSPEEAGSQRVRIAFALTP